MASTIYTPVPSSSSPWFTGQPIFVADTYDWQDDFQDIYARAIEQALDAGTKALREEAKEDPEWAPYADNISLEYKDGDVHYVFEGTDVEIREMEALEYGTGEDVPVPFIRRNLMKQKAIIGEELDLALAEELPRGD